MERTIVLCDDKTVDRTDQVEILKAAGATLETLDDKTEEAVAAAVSGADGIIVDAATPVTRRVLERTDTLRVIGRAGIGVDNIDVEAAANNGITVVNVPDYSLEEVSTHAFALLLACNRAIPRYDRAVKAGTWDWKTGRPLRRLSGGTLGLIGFGSIARRLAAKLRTFGVDVIATDPYVDASTMLDYDVEKVSFDGLLERVDYLSIHVPLYDETRHMLSTDEFERLPDDCTVINTSRGPVIDETALVAALETGEIARAGLESSNLNHPPARIHCSNATTSSSHRILHGTPERVRTTSPRGSPVQLPRSCGAKLITASSTPENPGYSVRPGTKSLPRQSCRKVFDCLRGERISSTHSRSILTPT